jgi:hypothetical protein
MEKLAPLCLLQKYHCWVAGDQQAALLVSYVLDRNGQNTYGTGCFMLMNRVNQITYSKNNLQLLHGKLMVKQLMLGRNCFFCRQCLLLTAA